MNYDDMLDIKLCSEIKGIDLDPIITKIEELKSASYWQSKNERLSKLIDSQLIAEILTKSSVGFCYQIQELIGRIAPKISKCKYEDAIRNASDVIEACEDIIYEVVIGDHIMVNSLYFLEADTYEYIALRKFNPPMVVTPKNWETNSDGGYYDNGLHCILGSIHSQHHKPQALDVLNILQDIEWELDPEIVEYDELPNKEFKSSESHEQFKVMAMESRKVYEKYTNKPFYFIWQYDKRGRQYSKGYHINLQASGYKKALLNFSQKHLITGEL
jgi:hypothetical protein